MEVEKRRWRLAEPLAHSHWSLSSFSGVRLGYWVHPLRYSHIRPPATDLCTHCEIVGCSWRTLTAGERKVLVPGFMESFGEPKATWITFCKGQKCWTKCLKCGCCYNTSTEAPLPPPTHQCPMWYCDEVQHKAWERCSRMARFDTFFFSFLYSHRSTAIPKVFITQSDSLTQIESKIVLTSSRTLWSAVNLQDCCYHTHCTGQGPDCQCA